MRVVRDIRVGEILTILIIVLGMFAFAVDMRNAVERNARDVAANSKAIENAARILNDIQERQQTFAIWQARVEATLDAKLGGISRAGDK